MCHPEQREGSIPDILGRHSYALMTTHPYRAGDEAAKSSSPDQRRGRKPNMSPYWARRFFRCAAEPPGL